ncbi:MAG: tyrosine-type recombinase/integrase [Candidatus Koribacter versatilis]|uniref:Tyrosine-type recombinase/integrase n=1 Tax=Candidatus Korobacter versatilis TaxID=658062 RepID=A0A932A769_9BACT|nr:tyrosine-type recombinase/integrase [Candidatus Koribacter versatilis]
MEPNHTLCHARCGYPVHRALRPHLTTLAERFRDAREKAGISPEMVLYCGRHDYGTRMMERTGNLKAVMKVMGHRDVKTAMKYQHPELEIVRAALEKGSEAKEASASKKIYGTLCGTPTNWHHGK